MTLLFALFLLDFVPSFVTGPPTIVVVKPLVLPFLNGRFSPYNDTNNASFLANQLSSL